MFLPRGGFTRFGEQIKCSLQPRTEISISRGKPVLRPIVVSWSTALLREHPGFLPAH